LIYFLFFSDFFQIKEIVISGQNRVKREEIEKVIKENLEKKFFVFKGNNIFFANLDQVKNEILKKFPQIEELEFKRKIPDKLLVNVREKKEVALFFQNEKTFLLDENGIIFEEATPEVQLLKIESFINRGELVLGEKVIEKETLTKILEIEKKLKDLNISLEKVSIISEDNLHFKTKEDWEIFIDPQKDTDWQITKLKVALENAIPKERIGDLEYIDLRFGNFAYPKYKK
jgi:cell division protein FtsQ